MNHGAALGFSAHRNVRVVMSFKLLTSGFVHPSEKGNIQVISAPWASGVLLGAVVCAGPFERFQASVVQLYSWPEHSCYEDWFQLIKCISRIVW